LDDHQGEPGHEPARPPNFGFSVTRVLQDGANTFVKAVHEPEGDSAAWLTMSLIRTDPKGLMSVRRQISVTPVSEDKLVSSMAAYAVPTGAAENTEVSREQVRAFIDAVVTGKGRDVVDAHVDRAAFDLNRMTPSGDRERLDDLIERRRPRNGLRYHGIDDMVAEGDFVAVFSCFDADGDHFRACDLFRLEGGKIVEHWDAIQSVEPHTVAHNDEA